MLFIRNLLGLNNLNKMDIDNFLCTNNCYKDYLCI